MNKDKASSTAFTVMQGLLYTAKSPDYGYLVDDQTVAIGRQILSASSHGQKCLKQLENPLITWLLKLKEAIILPGISLHYALRKRHIETITLDAIDKGIKQVVTLGAGFDALSFKLQEQHPDVTFIEIDHPATQVLKHDSLKGTKTKSSNLHFLSVDFTSQTLEQALQAFESFDGQLPTLFICEGVLMYLNEQDVNQLFVSIKSLCCNEVQFVFSTLEPQGSNKNTIPKLLYKHLKKIGEPINWDIASDAMPNFLANHECTVLSIAGRDELVAAYINDNTVKRLHCGEYFTHCEFATKANERTT